MTESGSDNSWHKNNDLGGRRYTDEEQQLLYFLASGLRHRDPFLTGKYEGAGYLSRTYRMPPDGVRPRDYVAAYTKIAGFVYELAKNLVVFPFPPQIPKKSLAEWIMIVTAMKVPDGAWPSITPELLPEIPLKSEPPGLHHVEVQLLLDGKVVASSSDPDPVQASLEADPLPQKASLNIESIDPERAKAILIRICEEFPGMLTNENVPGADLVMELGLYIRSAIESSS